jgi:hypothetical protein
MNERVAALAATLALAAGCATAPPPAGSFSFAVMGDLPYNPGEEVQFVRLLREVDADDVAFAVHVGDFKGGGIPCSDALFERRRAQFDASRHPFFFVPGDNEWIDCRRPENGGGDALERLGRLRQLFFSQPASLGQRRIAARSQSACLVPPVEGCGCGAHPENLAWSVGPVAFVSLNVSGSENNVGFDRANDEEARCRDAANGRWLDTAVGHALESQASELVVIVQANPWWSLHRGHERFVTQLDGAARRFRKPLLLVHGDTHTYRVDHPMPGVTRLETYGSPFVGWVKVTVAPGDAVPFRFDSRFLALVPRGL